MPEARGEEGVRRRAEEAHDHCQSAETQNLHYDSLTILTNMWISLFNKSPTTEKLKRGSSELAASGSASYRYSWASTGYRFNDAVRRLHALLFNTFTPAGFTFLTFRPFGTRKILAGRLV